MMNEAFTLAETTADFNIVTLIPQIGFAAIFLWQWLDATKERRAAQAALALLAERLLPVLEEATSTLERVQAGMEKQVEKFERNLPTPYELASTISRLERLITSTSSDLERRSIDDTRRARDDYRRSRDDDRRDRDDTRRD